MICVVIMTVACVCQGGECGGSVLGDGQEDIPEHTGRQVSLRGGGVGRQEVRASGVAVVSLVCR